MAVWSQIAYSVASSTQRFDSDCWKPEYIENEKTLKGMDCTSIGEATQFVRCGPFGSNLLCENYVPNGVLVLRPFNLKQLTVERGNLAYIPEEVCRLQRLGFYEAGDIMFARVGDVRAAALRAFPAKVTISPNVIAARMKPTAPDPYFTVAFLNTRYGLSQLIRGMKTVAQPTITVDLVKAVLVPKVPSNVQQAVRARVQSAFEQEDLSHTALAEAEAILTAALGLDRVDLTPRLFYEDTYAHAAAAARFDPEYYQPAKWNVLRALAAMPGKLLEEHFRPVKKLWQPTEQPASATVRNYDLTDALAPFLDDTTPTATAGEIKSTKKRFEPGDLVISRLRSYLKEIAVVLPSDGAPLVGSTEFIVLRSRKTGLSAEALLAFLRSTPIQTVLKWCQDGSNHPRFAEKELLRLPVPDAVLKVQDNITAKIKDAIAARQESRRLLDEAKRTVEAAIPKGGKA